MKNKIIKGKKNLVFILSTFLLTLAVALKADFVIGDSNLPALPPLEETQVQVTESKDTIPQTSKSFFQKIKDFFSFKKSSPNDKANIEENITKKRLESPIETKNELPIIESSEESKQGLANLPPELNENDFPNIDLPSLDIDGKENVKTSLDETQEIPQQAEVPTIAHNNSEMPKLPEIAETQVPDGSKSSLSQSNENNLDKELNNLEVSKLPEIAETQVPDGSKSSLSQSNENNLDKELNNLEVSKIPETNKIEIDTNTRPIEIENNLNAAARDSGVNIQKKEIENSNNLEKDKLQSETQETLASPLNTPITPPPPPPLSNQSLSKENYTRDKVVQESFDTSQFSPELTKFIIDEAKMLLLPNDEIVLGEVSEQVKIEQMDFNSYLILYKKIETKYKDADKEHIIDNFIVNYDANFNIKNILSVKEAINYAFDATRKNNVTALRFLLDNYPLLQKVDNRGYTLLHQAVEDENYNFVKFLLMRGINLNSYTFSHMTALSIAELEANTAIVNLLMAAGAK